MHTTDETVTRSPSILMIEGREYALYQGFRERTKLMDVKLLWLDGAKNLLLPVWVALMMSEVLFHDLLWSVFGLVMLILAAVVVGHYIDSHSVAVIPVSVVEKDRQGPSATLYIFLRSVRGFTTRRDGRYTATVHTDMADFLLGAIGPDRAHGRRSLPRIPTELRNPKARRFAWGSYSHWVSNLALAVFVVVLLVSR
ncbi:hypothetical protein [Demequina lutea]|uniref:Uncharacterized protein n=1 Tax=Demequina lutea TaxID=431489 RepID=A0A7Y9ZBJ7_9MICO|nr:hypothetical protein [Demequina lutea]NYI41825.1 hypothetical protein [Demequina lutea]